MKRKEKKRRKANIKKLLIIIITALSYRLSREMIWSLLPSG